MANIITYEYFRGGLTLPQTINADGQSLLTQFITQYEFEFLEKALGYELAKGLVANIASADPKWKDLREGVEFTDSRSRLTKWVGFQDNTNKISPIANYVYYKFLEDGITDVASIGTVQPKGENADRVYPQLKLQEAWNRMVDMLRILHDYLRQNPSTYPEFTYHRPIGVVKKINQFGI